MPQGLRPNQFTEYYTKQMINARFPRPRAIVFDLDGTLVDSAPDLGAALNRLRQAFDRPPLDAAAILRLIGDGAASLVGQGFAIDGIVPGDVADLTRQFLTLYEGDIATRTRPYPGVATTLQRLVAAGTVLGVCTNKADAATQRLLAALDLAQYFHTVVGGDGPARKPDPRHLLTTLDRLGVPAEAAVMVGDSANDVGAARGAGIPVVVVGFGYTKTPPAELGADALIHRFDELPRLLGY